MRRFRPKRFARRRRGYGFKRRGRAGRRGRAMRIGFRL